MICVESEYPTESAERLFDDNVKYGAMLQKRKTKVNKNLPPRLKCYEKEPTTGLTPTEVCQCVALHGVKLTDRTLRNYVKGGKISAPYVKSLGRALGKKSLYPQHVIEQILSFKRNGGA